MAEKEPMGGPAGDAFDPEFDPDFDAEFADIEAVLRSLSPDDLEPIEPPPHVWQGIEAAVAAERVSPPVDLMEYRRRRMQRLTAVAATLIVVVGLGAYLFGRGGENDGQVIAAATLEFDEANFDPLGAKALATVSLVDDEGAYRLAFDQADLPQNLRESADLELWLIEPDADGQPQNLRSLGLIDADDLDEIAIPADVDPAKFRVVDISVEPRDGDAAHSGRSILRGPLETL